MSEVRGKIGVTSENIFPIIKKFLYNDQEIFLREIVSNAVDASQKLRTVALQSSDLEIGDLSVEVILDKEARTLTVRDRGVGMTREEVERYINQIALSGAQDFFEKYKDSTNIIGHFGLGFYSSFMVSSRVEIDTLSWQPGAQAVRWSCEGEPEFVISQGERTERGTDIIMHIAEDADEFLNADRIEGLLEKYCRFLPVPIIFGKEKEWKEGKQVELDEPHVVNSEDPLWTKRPSELEPHDYESFYHYLFPGQEAPLFYIHLNVDYPFTLTGILYFPRIKSHFDIQKNRIQLYCNQVFVTDIVEGIVPDYLTLLKGIIDSPDIPLNVSRSSLQNDSQVRRIASHISKKVSDRLLDLFKEDRKEFEEKWPDLKLFVQYGLITEEGFYDRTKDFLLFTNVDGKSFTLEEYSALVDGEQTNRHGKRIYLYSTDPQGQWAEVDAAQRRGYDVLLMDGQLDLYMINFLEEKLEDVHFVRVDSDTLDRLIEKEEAAEVPFSVDEQKYLRFAMNGAVERLAGTNLYVGYEHLSPEAAPAQVTRSEYMRRMKDMAAMSPSGGMYGGMPDALNLVLNTAHPLVERLRKEVMEMHGEAIRACEEKVAPLQKELEGVRERTKGKKYDEVDPADRDREQDLSKEIEATEGELREKLMAYGREWKLANQVADLALLSAGLLKGEALARFVERSVSMIE